MIYLKDYQKPLYQVEHTDLIFRLHPEKTEVYSTLSVRPAEGTAPGTPWQLDCEDLQILSLTINGQKLLAEDYHHEPHALTLLQPPKEAFQLEILTQINPKANTQLSGLYLSNGIYCTQCEAEGFRRIIPFPDRPDQLSTYRVRIEADGDLPVLLSNGNPVDKGELEGGRHFALWDDPHPKPSYLFALVAGQLDHLPDSFRTRDGRDVTLGIYVEQGKKQRAHYAMDALKRSMRWDEERFNFVYDLDVFNIVAVSDFNMGAMENKGLNIFNDKYILASSDTATDMDYQNIESIIAHEYFHNWTGNRITCRDWFQLCLKEGLTVFRDQEFSQDVRGREVCRIQDVNRLWTHQFAEDGGPLRHPVRPQAYAEINNFYTATVYQKGAEIVRMLQTMLGEDLFQKGMQIYFQDFDGTAATIEDFLHCFEKASHKDLSAFLRWYNQAGTPRLAIDCQYDAGAHTLTCYCVQSEPDHGNADEWQLLPIPIALTMMTQEGDEMALDHSRIKATGGQYSNGLFLLEEAQGSLIFHNLAERPVMSFLNGFSAPVNITTTHTRQDKVLIAMKGRDAFTRWQAGRELMLSHLAMTMAHQDRGSQGTSEPSREKGLETVIDACIHSVLEDDGLEKDFKALLLSVPDENDLARHLMQDINPDDLARTVKHFRQSLGARHYQAFINLFESNGVIEPYAPSPRQAAQRQLRLRGLSLAAHSRRKECEAIITGLYHSTDNMTERSTALRLATHLQIEAYQDVLDHFYQNYCEDPLLFDKWLSMQATATEGDVIGTIRQLTQHERFSWTNPNRVRALFGSFAMGNMVQFHRKDGEGYALMCDVIATLDEINPQTAARLLTAFRSWKTLTEPYQIAIREELSELQRRPKLSRDVHDILNRMLS
jgi:aminopeptidase N